MTERFVIGLIGAPFGIEGFVKIRPLSGEIEHLLKLQSVTIRKEGKETQLIIEESSALGPLVIMRFTGFTTPEKAKTLGGAELLADREQASPLGPGEFYIEDLKGLAVYAGNEPNKEIIGHITGIVEGGGGELAEIRLCSGEIKLVPFRQDFFPEIDPEKGSVTLQNLWILE